MDVQLAVNGTLMRGLELNENLVAVGARFDREATTAPSYRLWSIEDRHPAMVRTSTGGAAVAVEVWSVPAAGLATLLLGEPPGLCVGKVRLADGQDVLGEMSLITARQHSATVEAVTDCQFALLTRAQFQRLLDAESLAAYKLIATIAEVLAGRVTRLDQKVLELTAVKERAPAVEELAAFKQKLFSEWSF